MDALSNIDRTYASLIEASDHARAARHLGGAPTIEAVRAIDEAIEALDRAREIVAGAVRAQDVR